MIGISPYYVSSRENAECVCIGCGLHGTASRRISSYPHRFMPETWTVCGDGRLQCPACGPADIKSFYENFEVAQDEHGAIHTRERKVRRVPGIELLQEIRDVKLMVDSVGGGVMTIRNHLQERASNTTADKVQITSTEDAMLQKFLDLQRGVESMVEPPTKEDLRALEMRLASLERERLLAKRQAMLGQGLRGRAQAPQQVSSDEHIETEDTMADDTKTTDEDRSAIKQQLFDLGDAVMLGTKLAAAKEVGDVLLDIARDLAKDFPVFNQLLETTEGRELAKTLIALAVHSLATHTDFVPKSDLVKQAAEAQLTVSAMTLVGSRLKNLKHYASRLGSIGEQIAGATGERFTMAPPEVRAPAMVDGEPVPEVAEVETEAETSNVVELGQ